MLRRNDGLRANVPLLFGLLATAALGCSSSGTDINAGHPIGITAGSGGSAGGMSAGGAGGGLHAGGAAGAHDAGGGGVAGAGRPGVGGAGAAGAAPGGTGGSAAGKGGNGRGGAGKSGSGSSAGGNGTGGAGGGGTPPPGTDDLIVAPDGVDDAPGTLDAPTTLASALTRITAGHIIFARDGRYEFAQQLTIARGLEVLGAADNGIYVSGNGNVIEACVTHGNRDTGLQLGRASSSDADMASWPSNNLILDCESYDNYDAPPGSGENADGFAAKLTVGSGNVFRGCVSHNNIDDGWDLYTKNDTGPIGPVTIDQCISYANGTLTDGTSNANGDRNGFKLGGDDIAVAHVVTRSVAFDNGKNGFTWNSNPGAIRLSNNLAFDNVEGNFKFGDNSTATSAVFTNNVSFWTVTAGSQGDKVIGTDTPGTNAWWDDSKNTSTVAGTSIAVTAADFASSLAAAKVARNADMSLNFAPFALAPASDLVNAGVVPPGTLPFDATSYYVDAPDLGAVEAH